MNHIGFKKALISIVSLLVLLSLSITIIVSNQVLKSSTSEALVRSMLNSATYESFRIASHVEKSASTVSGLAKLYDTYSLDTPSEKLVELSKHVANVHKVTAGFEDGRSYSSKHDANFPNGVGDITKYDPRPRPWFKQGLASNGLELSDVFFTTVGQQPMLGAIHPVNQGVLLVDIRLNHLHDLLKEMKVVDGAVGIITDGEGLILASTTKHAPIRKKLSELPITSSVAPTIFANDHTINTINIEGNDNVLVSKKIKLVSNKQWYLMIAVDTDIAFASVNAAAWKLNSLAFTIAIISILILLYALSRLYKPVLELKATVQKLSDGNGDLTSRLTVKSNDDLGDIARGINSFIQGLQSMMLEVQSMTTRLSDGVNILKGEEKQSSGILKDHVSETELVVTAMEELSCSAKLVSEHAEDTVNYTTEANNIADNSKGTIDNAQQSLHSLVDEVETTTVNVTNMSKETQDISSILGVIGGIAEQTNLLALNAAIEAARAGEQGRGFAVVADEVRALAGKTQQSTSEIEAALTSLKGGASSVVTAIERTGDTSQKAVSEAQAVADNLGNLGNYVTQINDLSAQISTSANEQNTVIQELNRNMSRIHHMVEGLSEKGQSMRNETGNIESINTELVNIVSKFKLN